MLIFGSAGRLACVNARPLPAPWEQVVQKPFTTWLKLEETYRFVQEHAPELMGKPLTEAISASAHLRVRQAAEKTSKDDALSWGGDRRSNKESSGNLPLETQAQRATSKGVGARTQRKLDRIARDYPEQHARIKDGTPSVHGAFVEVGLADRTVPLPLDPTRATRVIVEHSRGEALAGPIRGLARDRDRRDRQGRIVDITRRT